jgi:lanthanide-dependent methanol dehydrogenase
LAEKTPKPTRRCANRRSIKPPRPLIWISLAVGLIFANVVRALDAAPAQQISATRSIALTQIDRDNVSRLKPVVSFRTGTRGAQGGAPLVVGSTLYFLTSFPHILFALDLGRPGAPVRWQFTPEHDPLTAGLACCNRIEHGPVFGAGHIYFSTLDGRVIALDPDTGQVAWNVVVADIHNGETLVSPPTVVGNELVIGNGGDDFGARGWIVALDIHTGRQIWKHYSTGPDQEVGITPAGQDRGSKTWPGESWQHGGGSVAAPILADPELGLLLHSTGPPAPWNPEPRPGDNAWTSGIFAREPDTGTVRWFAPLHPHNSYAWAADTADIPLDRSWNGKNRQLLLHADADGRLYVLDRASGELLAADALLSPSAGSTPQTNLQVRNICPAWVGAIGGNPALAATTGFLYIPMSRLCMDIEARNASYLQGTPYIGANVRVHSTPGEARGELVAWDLERRAVAWKIDERFPVASDVLVTAGGLVFYGTLDGVVKAVDATSGKVLWHWQTNAGISSQPMTFVGADGRQYFAVIAGLGGPYGVAHEYWIDRRDATAVRGLAQPVADLPAPADPSGTLYVFDIQ